ncbi:hypothetical protein E2562_038186 [Oryza meyeriana var. granulata]|uniref:Uncharacterized protein n=1 Tax=Oryza meyeriana var. granulata TaxID=110450 RepID=A0A6G1CLX4_9ORYZ|nr:hypothetical protein E2562_038186 [Oryza meyeriana var. granulata]
MGGVDVAAGVRAALEDEHAETKAEQLAPMTSTEAAGRCGASGGGKARKTAETPKLMWPSRVRKPWATVTRRS